MLHCLCYNEYGFPRPDHLSRRFRLGRTFHFGIRFEKQAEVNQAANADNAINDPGDRGIVPKNGRYQIKVEKTDKAQLIAPIIVKINAILCTMLIFLPPCSMYRNSMARIRKHYACRKCEKFVTFLAKRVKIR